MSLLEAPEEQRLHLLRAIEKLVTLGAQFAVQVRRELAADGLDSSDTSATTPHEDELPVPARRFLTTLRSTFGSAEDAAAPMAAPPAQDDGAVDIFAVSAADHIHGVLRSLLPFVLRCVRKASSIATQPAESQHSSSSETAEHCDTGTSAATTHRASTLHHSSEDSDGVVASLSDEQVRSVLVDIEYDRRMKLFLRMHQEMIRRMQREWAEHISAAHSSHELLSFDQTLSPVVVPADSVYTPVAEQQSLEKANYYRQGSTSAVPSFSVPPPLQFGHEEPAATTRGMGTHKWVPARSPISSTALSAEDVFGTSVDVDTSIASQPAFASSSCVPSYYHTLNSGAAVESCTGRCMSVDSEVSAISSVHSGSCPPSPRKKERHVRYGADSKKHHSAPAGPASLHALQPDYELQRTIVWGFDVAEMLETQDTATSLAMPVMRVMYVFMGTVADLAGIWAGDVLHTINEYRVRTHAELAGITEELNRQPPHTPIHIHVLRNGKLLKSFIDPDTPGVRSQAIPSLLPVNDRVRNLVRHAGQQSPERTPVRRDLLGTYAVASSPSPQRSLRRSPSPGHYETSLNSKLDERNQQHVMYHNPSMLSRLQKTLGRINDLRHQREVLLSAKESVRSGRHFSDVSSAVSTSSHAVDTSATSTASYRSSPRQRHLRSSVPNVISKASQAHTPGASPQRMSPLTSLRSTPPRNTSPRTSPLRHSPWR